MTLQTIEFDKNKLFLRCRVDISTRGIESKPDLEMCEHDKSWFIVALTEASNVVLSELSRIAKEIEDPISEDEEHVSFTVFSNKRQSRLLPEAIERYLISHVVNLWYKQRLNTSVLDMYEVLLNLKQITLITGSFVCRKHNL